MRLIEVSSVKILGRLFGTIVTCFLIASVYAQFGGGAGTEDDPWQIGRPEHLNEIRNHLDGNYIQTDDINLDIPPYNEEEGWVPLSSDNNRFTGSYNGNGYVINGLFMNRPEENYQALFGYCQGASISNLGLTNVNITGRAITGSLIGRNNNSSVNNCYSIGTIVATQLNTGGLVGFNDNSSIRNSYTICTLSGTENVGGIAGTSRNNSSIINCYTLGNITATANYIGGLVGFHDTSVIRNCYSRGSIIGNLMVAGLVASSRNNSTITNCYSTGRVRALGDRLSGGLVAHQSNASVINSYWNVQTSEQETSEGGFGRTTMQMVYPYDEPRTVYNGWDFDELWVNDVTRTINDGYPILFYQVELLIDAPQITVERVIIDDTDHIRISWEPVENALSYKIYASFHPYADDWGDPVSVVGEDITQFTESIVIEQTDTRFYRVTASLEDTP